jgi:hypothetical protein
VRRARIARYTHDWYVNWPPSDQHYLFSTWERAVKFWVTTMRLSRRLAAKRRKDFFTSVASEVLEGP